MSPLIPMVIEQTVHGGDRQVGEGLASRGQMHAADGGVELWERKRRGAAGLCDATCGASLAAIIIVYGPRWANLRSGRRASRRRGACPLPLIFRGPSWAAFCRAPVRFQLVIAADPAGSRRERGRASP
jgi:hypothetical protein